MEHLEDKFFVDHFHEAIAAGFIKPYFQPVYRSMTGKMYGAEALARNVPRDAINLEITESLMLEDIETFQRVFLQFHNAGFSIWLDDFGSGYSSLNVLQNYSFDMIKFDMLFLRNFSLKGKQLLASLINMAKILGVHTLVEGVETQSIKSDIYGSWILRLWQHVLNLIRENSLRVILELNG